MQKSAEMNGTVTSNKKANKDQLFVVIGSNQTKRPSNFVHFRQQTDADSICLWFAYDLIVWARKASIDVAFNYRTISAFDGKRFDYPAADVIHPSLPHFFKNNK